MTRKIKFISSIHEEQSEEDCSRKYGGLDTVASVNVKANHSGQTISCFSREENLLIIQKQYRLMGLIYRSNRTTSFGVSPPGQSISGAQKFNTNSSASSHLRAIL